MKRFIVITANVKLHRIVELAPNEDPKEIAQRKLDTGNWLFWHHEPIDFKVTPLSDNNKKVIMKPLDMKTISKRKLKEG